MLRAVIFDIDETLLDWTAAIDRALAGLLTEFPPAHREGLPGRLRRAIEDQAFVVRDGAVVDRRYWLLLVDPLPPWQAAFAGADPGVAASAARRFQSLLEPVPFPDAQPTLEALSNRFTLGVLSNSPRAGATIDHLGLHPYFHAVVAADEAYRKPHPRAFHAACAALGVRPRDAAYVGDSIVNDVEGAAAAGLIPIWLDRQRDAYSPPGGVHRVESLDELPALLETLPS